MLQYPESKPKKLFEEPEVVHPPEDEPKKLLFTPVVTAAIEVLQDRKLLVQHARIACAPPLPLDAAVMRPCASTVIEVLV